MSRWKMWMLGAGGFLLPVALVFTAVFISRELNASAKVPGLDSPVPAATAAEREGRGGPGSSDDRSDRCAEPEHAADPTCASASGTSGSGGGSSSGGDGQSSVSGPSSEPSPIASPTREDNSGPGSSSSGSGSGSDDSGSGSSGGDNSGPGSGDD